MSATSRLKATKIIGQRKAIYKQRIPQCSYAKKETVNIDILLTSRNGNRKILQAMRIMSRPHLREVEPVEPVLKHIYHSNTYRKDLSWPHFIDVPKVQYILYISYVYIFIYVLYVLFIH